MKELINKFFVFMSYGVVRGIGVRARIQMFFSILLYIFFLATLFLLFKLLSVPRETGAIFLMLSLGVYFFIYRIVNSYTDNNWQMLSYGRPAKVPYLWARRAAVWLLSFAVIVGMACSGYQWAKHLS